MQTPRSTTALGLMIAALAAGACGAGDNDAANGRRGTATLLYWQAPTTLNTYLSGGTKEAEAASLVLEPLAEYDENGQLVPALATRIPTRENGGISPDLTTITWNLIPGVVWSDGTPLTAADVVFTWRYCTAPGGGCAYASSFENVTTVEAVDDRTVTVTFDRPKPHPYSPFVSYLSPIIQAAQFAKCLGAAAVECTEANFRPIGTGPYVVSDFRTNDAVAYQRNPRYRGAEAGLPRFDQVILKGGGDAAAAARSVLQLGEADYAWNLQVEPEVLASMASGGTGTVVSAFAAGVERLEVNQTNPDPRLGNRRSEYAGGSNPHPFLTDPVVGRALSLAIDRATLVRVGYGVGGRATCNVWPAPPASTNNDECLVQNIDLANRILDEAGIVDSNGDGVRERRGVPLDLLFQTSTNSVRQAAQELIKSWWARIGVRTELKNVDSAVFFGSDLGSPDTFGKFYADVQMYTNTSPDPDPERYLGGWLSTRKPGRATGFLGENVARFHSGEFDRLFGELQRTAGAEKRAAIAATLNDTIVQSYATIPLVYRGEVAAHASDVDGVRMNGWDSDLWNFEQWSRR
jgi:peptide/nickel transport system substrate-binding protein